jgi:hypothetical protein
MYNLLTGYHAGTNRAVFLMLPRPHILQPTDRRTFIQGLRVIEGIQEFFLIIPRSRDIEGLSVEASLETGHFPEDIDIQDQQQLSPPDPYVRITENFIVNIYADPNTPKEFEESHQVIREGFVIDVDQDPDNGHVGIQQLLPVHDDPGPKADGTDQINLRAYNYQAVFENTVKVVGRIKGHADGGVTFNRTYKVFLRSEKPKPESPPQPPSVTVPFIITSRGLDASFKSGDEHPGVVPVLNPLRNALTDNNNSIVDEHKIEIDPKLLIGEVNDSYSRLPAIKQTMRKVQNIMNSSWRLRSRSQFGQEKGFLESSYFKDHLVVPQ